MLQYLLTWMELTTDRRAVTAVEYAILAGVVITILAGVGASFGNSLATAFTSLGGSLDKHVLGD